MRFFVVFALFVVIVLASGQPLKSGRYEEIREDPVVRPQRQVESGHGHHDAVDFGAHTGDHGAFGWYADFPVH